MRYITYFLLLYLFLPFNNVLDFIAVLIFYILINESAIFSIFFAFFCGLLTDLYYPASLGTNSLIYLILGQGLIYFKDYLIEEPITISIVFVMFYFLKIIITLIFGIGHFSLNYLFFTILFYIGASFLLNKIFFKVWLQS